MVKGVSKRVIVVKSPDPKIFEQAIFIVREDYMRRGGADAESVLREARRAARAYVRGSATGKRRSGFFARIPPALLAAAGAAATGIAWLAMRLVGV